MSDLLYGLTVGEIISMDFEELGKTILQNSELSFDEIVLELTVRRLFSENITEKAACSRIISVLLDGPDTLNI